MDSRGLLIAVRHNNVNLVSRLISEGVDINGLSQVEPFVPRPQELPLYDSFPLFEACRSRNFDMIQLLLQFPEINVNARATRLQVTPFCDACARGDTMIASLLLSDPRVDGRIGSTVVSRPVLYACMTGALQLLKLCAEHGLLDDEAESSAVSTARANGALFGLKCSLRKVFPMCIFSTRTWNTCTYRPPGSVEVYIRALC
jgi:hypothetical protein